MKNLASIIVIGIAVLIGAHFWGVEFQTLGVVVDPTFDKIITVGVIGIVSILLGSLEILGVLAIAGLLGGITREKGIFSLVVILLLIPVAFFVHPLVLKVVSTNFEWVPNFTYWQWFAINIVSAFLNASGSSSSSDKK